MEESVIINVKIDGTENEAKIDSLTASIIALQNENKKLADTNKTLAKAEGDNTKAIVDNAKQIEINKQKITENSAQRKGLIQTIVAEDNSIKALSIRNAQLIKERNLINTGTEEGRKKIAAINAQLDANNTRIKDNSSALEKQKINIGNYASALDGIVPGLGGFVNGLQGATTAAKAFIATPIGIILAAVASALALVSSYFTRTEEGGDLLAKRMAQLSAAFNVVLDRLAVLGKGIVQFISGDFSAGIDTVTMAFSGMGDEMEREVRVAGELADVLDELGNREIEYEAQLSKTANQIKILMLASRSRALTEEQRMEKLEQALALERQQNEVLLGIKRDALNATLRQAELDDNAGKIRRLNNESDLAYAERLMADHSIQESILRNVLKAYTDLNTAQGSSLALQEKIQTQQDNIAEQQEARINKEVEAILKKRELQVEDIDTETAIGEQKIELATTFEQSVADVRKSFRDQDTKNAKEQAKLIVAIEADKQQKMAMLGALAMSTARQLAGSNKALQSSLTLIDTYFSAQRAFASQVIPGDPSSLVRAIAAAALTTISGLARVAQINGIQFAAGGIAQTGGVLNGPSHANGGIPFAVGGRLGFEAEGGEAIINKRSTAMFRPMLSAINQAGGGKAFAAGGITGNEVRAATQQAMGSFNANQMAGLINQVRTVLVLQDFEAVQASRDNTVSTAEVLGA